MNHAFGEVYHCSPVQGLTLISPRVSTHGQNWVYATGNMVMSSVFLGREGGDLTCATGTLDGTPYVAERFEGAIDCRYEGIRGSPYTLPGHSFMEGRTTWSHDLVSGEAVTPFRETRVDNAKDYLLRLAAEGRLIVKFYPDRLAGISDDEPLGRTIDAGAAGSRDAAAWVGAPPGRSDVRNAARPGRQNVKGNRFRSPRV